MAKEKVIKRWNSKNKGTMWKGETVVKVRGYGWWTEADRALIVLSMTLQAIASYGISSRGNKRGPIKNYFHFHCDMLLGLLIYYLLFTVCDCT